MNAPKRPNQSLVPLAVFGAFAAASMGWYALYRHGPRQPVEEPALTSRVSPSPPPVDAAVDAGPPNDVNDGR